MKGRRIAIIGAGICGLAVSRLLAKKGLEITLYERFDNPTSIGAGLLIQPLGLEILSQMGLLERVVETGSIIHAMRGTNQRGRVIMDVRYAELSSKSKSPLYGLGVHRNNLFKILYQAAIDAGVNITTGSEILDITKTHTSNKPIYSVLNKHDEIETYDAIIIANGTHSSLRKYLHVAQKCKPYPWGALWSILPADLATSHSACLDQRYAGSAKMAGILPTGIDPVSGEPCVSFFWSMPVDKYSDWRESSFQDWKRTVLEFEPSYTGLFEHLNSHDDLAFAQYADVVMSQWNDAGMLCVGDAAHGMSPQLGLGANLALVDAVVLSDCVDDNATLVDAFADYSRRRRNHLRYYHWASRWLTPLFQSNSVTAGRIRDATFPHLNKIPFAYREALRTISGVKTGIVFDKSLYEL